MLGAVPLYVASQMGHADTMMITRNYGKWIKTGLTAIAANACFRCISKLIRIERMNFRFLPDLLKMGHGHRRQGNDITLPQICPKFLTGRLSEPLSL